MEKGTVKKIVEKPIFNGLRNWEIDIQHEDGPPERYKRFLKDYDINFSEGDVITFELNKKGSMISVHKEGDSVPQQTHTPGKEPPPPFEPAINLTKQKHIERQSSLKLALDFLSSQARDKFAPTDVIDLADYFVSYIETGESPGGEAWTDPPW